MKKLLNYEDYTTKELQSFYDDPELITSEMIGCEEYQVDSVINGILPELKDEILERLSNESFELGMKEELLFNN